MTEPSGNLSCPDEPTPFADVTFHPWMGSGYGCSRSRVLIVGESHYGDAGTEHAEFTTEVVRMLAIEGRFAFFTKIAKLGLGATTRWISDEERAGFYQRIAFYNYVQTFMSGPRVRPSPAQWDAAARVFPAVRVALKPERVLVLGLQLGAHMNDAGLLGANDVVLRHPSSPGFSYRDAQTRLDAVSFQFRQGISP